jgi:hypothetical protein
MCSIFCFSSHRFFTDNDCPYLVELTMSRLAQEHLALDALFPHGTTISSSLALPRRKALVARMHILANYSRQLQAHPNSTSTASLILGLWPTIRNAFTDATHLHLCTVLLHRHIMWATYQCWLWLSSLRETEIPSLLESLWEGRVFEYKHWVTPLVVAVHRHYMVCDGQETSLQSTLLDLDIPIQQHALPPVTRRMACVAHRKTCVTAVSNVLAHWLHFPRSSVRPQKPGQACAFWPIQGRFISHVLDALGEQALYLSRTWEAFHSPAWHVARFHRAPANSTASISEEKWKEFDRQLSTHPVGQHGSPEHTLTSKIAALFVPFLPKPFFETDVETAAKLFTDFCKEYIATDNPAFAAWYSEDRDKYSAIREAAPSRLRMQELDGPFSTERLRTRAGFFSALVYRGVIYNSKALHQHSCPVFFSSLQHFTQYRDRIAQSDLCNQSAYGTPIAHLGAHNAEAYWDHSALWMEFLSKYPNDKPNFWELRSFIAQTSQFGPLLSYLLAVDYAYAGLVEAPSSEDLGREVFRMSRGGYRGIQYLGLFSRSLTEHDFQETFHDLFRRANEIFTQEEKNGLGWDLFVFEHALCKLCRAMYHGVWSVTG